MWTPVPPSDRALDSQGGFGVLGTWWRFDRYEIRQGVLRPAQGAKLESYDPWAAFTEARSGWGGTGGKAPYELLLDLVWSIRLLPTAKAGPPQLEPESEQALLNWCATHGLLGLLPHEAEVAYPAPRWGAVREFELLGVPFVMTRMIYQWGATGWRIGMDARWRTKTRALEKAPKQENALVPRSLVPESWGVPSVLCRRIGDASWATLPIEDAWGPFFPDVPEADRRDYDYPLPLLDLFWFDYAEPLSAFLKTATLFAETLQNLDAELRAGEQELEAESRREVADQALFSFLGGVQPAFAPGTGGTRMRAFHAKSLLASLAMMAYLDLTSGKRILRCDEDRRPFVSGAYQARYCSDRCRNRALKRAYRQRLQDRGVDDDSGTDTERTGRANTQAS